MEKHYFASANTPGGFVSRFDDVLPFESAACVVYIKGGSGTGKSTLMKKFAKELARCGRNVDYCHCSSAPASLDGVCDTAFGLAMFDGTAPHTMDPHLPGAVDMILNLGDFWDASLLKKSRDKLLLYSAEKASAYRRGYAFLKSALALILPEAPDLALARTVSDSIIKAHGLDTPGGDDGKMRRLFASGITSDGITDYLDTILTGQIIGLTDSPESPVILNTIADNAVFNGHDVDAFFCPFNPGKLEHLVISDLNISFTTLNRFHAYTDLFALYEFDKMTHIPETVYLIDKATDEFKRAKNIHAEIEKIYIPAMDFDALDRECEKVLSTLLGS